MKKILAVDDEPAIVTLIGHVLHREGYAVCTSTNPLEFEALLAREQPDLVLLDVRMPNKDGLSLLDDLKRHHRSMPVLFVTGFPDSFDVSVDRVLNLWREHFADGSVDILYKPFKAAELVQKVHVLIGPAGAPP